MIKKAKSAGTVLAMCALYFGAVSATQAQSAIQMEVLRERAQDDKKQMIAANLDLTASEAEEFWPIYDEYQTELEVLNSRIGWLIRDFGAAYDADSISDEQAQDLLDEAIAIQEDETAALKKYARQIRRVIPAAEVVRYLQLENKIRAAIRFDLAENIALFE